MNALGIAFSARRGGSSEACLKHCLDKLKAKAFETKLVCASDLDIRPCHRCRYQCMRKRDGRTIEECPVNDDVQELYRAAVGADLLLLAVPTYGGHVSALYRAWDERAQMLSDEALERLDAILRGVIVIGNASAGGGLALHGVVSSGWSTRPEAVLLSALDYGQCSVEGRLAEEAGVQRRLDVMVDRLVKRLTQ